MSQAGLGAHLELKSITKQLEVVMIRVDGMEKAHREYDQQNNATVNALDTKTCSSNAIKKSRRIFIYDRKKPP